MDLEGILFLNIMKYLMVVAGLFMFVIYSILARRYKGQICAPIKWIIAGLGLYWAFYYFQSILGGLLPAHQIWVRSPLFVTLTAFTAMGILSLRKLEK